MHFPDRWLTDLNKGMKKEGRSILLVVDNCSVHPKKHLSLSLSWKFDDHDKSHQKQLA